MKKPAAGINAALASAFFLGMAPVFGKLAIRQGMAPLGVVALRTVGAAILLFLVILIFRRQFLYIYPAGLLGCFLAGFVNGLGSLLYYSSLGRIDASLGQLLYSLYPIFVMLWLWIDKVVPSRMTLLRLFLIIPALYLLTQGDHADVDILGVLMMLGASILYALHLPINQRVLFDMPAPTVTLYTLFSMSLVVIPAYLFSGNSFLPALDTAWEAVVGMTLVTFFSRLTLFLGVKHLGGMQTALLGLGELIVTLAFAGLWLGERLTFLQWVGAGLLMLALLLVFREKTAPIQRFQGPLFGRLESNSRSKIVKS
jgi:drug/metabolite transporter (DMT)-like permease